MDSPLEYADFVKLVIQALEAAHVDYLIGGAVAAWAWGEPRSTLDLDAVVDIPVDRVIPLSRELGNRGMLVPPEIILDSLIEDRADIPINAIHGESGFKADLYPVRPHDALRLTAFQRRRSIDLGPQLGVVYLHSPEDLIIYKVWHFSISRQTKHLRDITAILYTLENELDLEYIQTWMNVKGLTSLWEELLKQHREGR